MNIQDPPALAALASTANQATKKNLRGSALLLVGRVIAMATNFAVQVLTVRYLSKGDYGAFAYVMSLISLGSSLAVFGMDKTVTRFLPIYQEKKEYAKLLGTLVIVVSTVFSLGFFLVLLVFGLRGWISGSFIQDEQAFTLLLLLIVLSPIQALSSLLVGMLAIFSKPSAIFFRRHILGPGLKLAVVLMLIMLRQDVYFLSIGYVVSSALGILIYAGILIRDLRHNELWQLLRLQQIRFPIREVFGFSAPLLTTNLVYVLRTQMVVVILQHFHGTLDVASYRAVQPVADLNTTVIQSFALLFMPAMARLFARNDQKGMDDLYWQNTIWIAVISFPIFLATFSLAEPLTILLFGEKYAQSGLLMALLSVGYYFNAALGFNSDTLRIHGRLRYTIAVDIVAMLINLGLSLALIPRFGAMGAALGTCGTLVIYNILNHVGLKFATSINLFEWHYIKVYASIILGALGLTIFQSMTSLPIYISLVLAGLISFLVLLINRDALDIEQTFPELLRIEAIRFLFGPRRSKKQLAE